MMTLIIGGSGSGKSAYAENYMLTLSKETENYYIATMQVYDKEGQEKVARHQKLRSTKGFHTIEQQTNIQAALEKMGAGKNAALLECMSNLVANEMFSDESPKTAIEVTQSIVSGVKTLNHGLANLVVVSNNVFEDGNIYEETTMEYIRAMGKVNEQLGRMADNVVEVVVGIPIVIKGFCECMCDLS